jgi:hypothetical protein
MRLNIRVIPNAKQNKLAEESGRIKIYLNSPPVEGKANKALVEFLAEHYNIKRNRIKIISGEKSRNKIIEIN